MIKIHRVFACFLIITLLIACGSDSKKSIHEKRAPQKERKASKSNKTPEKTLKAEDVADTEPSMTPEQIAKAEEIIKNVSDSDVNGVDANKLFRTHCAICHGFKGNMKVNGAKDLTKSKLPLSESVAQVYFGKGLMTPYKSILKEHEIVAVSKYIKTLR